MLQSKDAKNDISLRLEYRLGIFIGHGNSTGQEGVLDANQKDHVGERIEGESTGRDIWNELETYRNRNSLESKTVN